MSNAPVVSITDELLAELERDAAGQLKRQGDVQESFSVQGIPDTAVTMCCVPPATILSLIKHIRSLETELSIFKASDAQAIRWLAEIRSACGATHGMTFLEMVEHVRELRLGAERYDKLRTVTPYRFKKIQDGSITDGGDVFYFHSDKFDEALDASSSGLAS